MLPWLWQMLASGFPNSSMLWYNGVNYAPPVKNASIWVVAFGGNSKAKRDYLCLVL
jgi:hypothetical protein